MGERGAAPHTFGGSPGGGGRVSVLCLEIRKDGSKVRYAVGGGAERGHPRINGKKKKKPGDKERGFYCCPMGKEWNSFVDRPVGGGYRVISVVFCVYVSGLGGLGGRRAWEPGSAGAKGPDLG